MKKQNTKRLTLILIAFFILNITKAQQWILYTTYNSGLANNLNSCIAIDSQNNKWFGSSYNLGTITKFDGINWTTYDTPDNNNITGLAIDSQDNIWVATSWSLWKFDGANWTSFSGGGYQSYKAILIDSQNNKWFGMYTQFPAYPGCIDAGGIYIIDNNDNFIGQYDDADGLASDNIASIAIDNLGNKWFGTNDFSCNGSGGYGVSKFNGSSWITYTTANGLANNIVQAIAVDSQDNKWFGTRNGVSMFNGANWTTYKRVNGLACDTVSSIAIDIYGNKWFGTYGGGISKFDGTNWTTYKSINEITINSIYSIAIDLQGNIWFSSDIGVIELKGVSDIREQNEYSANIFILPNPAKDFLHIENTEQNKDAIISIYNLQGQLLLDQSLTQEKTEIDISDFAKGMYFVKVNTDKGITTNKFIKQ